MEQIVKLNDKEIKVTISSSTSWVNFLANQRLTDDEISELQIKLGYHPGGYGTYNIKKTNEHTEWACAGSCD